MASEITTPRILFLSENFESWCFPNYHYYQTDVLSELPGSVAYGPGRQSYTTNDVPRIIDEVFGDNPPDAVVCFVGGAQLMGKPIDEVSRQKLGLDDVLAVFPVGLEKVSIPKILLISDFWQCSKDEWDHILLSNGFSIAFSTCCPPFGSRSVYDSFFSPEVQEAVRFVPWPHSITPAIYKDYDLPKVHDVTLLGALHEGFYPLRCIMNDTFADARDLKYFNCAHPGYKFVSADKNLVGESYARVVNESRIFTGCTSIYGIPFQKIYEAMACRTVMMCDRPYGADYLGFVDRVNYIAINENDFLQTARHYLAHPDELDQIAANGRELFLARHTTQIRAAEFRETISALLGGSEPDGWATLFSDGRRLDKTWSDPRDAIIQNWRVFKKKPWILTAAKACKRRARSLASSAKRRALGPRKQSDH